MVTLLLRERDRDRERDRETEREFEVGKMIFILNQILNDFLIVLTLVIRKEVCGILMNNDMVFVVLNYHTVLRFVVVGA